MIVGSNLIFFENLPSTNSHAAMLCRETSPAEGTVVRAAYQSAGKGYSDNKWESEKDKNLLFSIILYPSFIVPSDQFLLSVAVSLAISDFLKRFSIKPSVKWPNDIYVNDDKIAGILIENAITGNNLDHSIVGIGININQEVFLSDAPNPVSLAMLTGREYDLTTCMTHILENIDRRYKDLLKEEYKILRDEYLCQLYKFNILSDYRDQNGVFKGTITGVSNEGILSIRRDDGSISDYSYKEVGFIGPRKSSH